MKKVKTAKKVKVALPVRLKARTAVVALRVTRHSMPTRTVKSLLMKSVRLPRFSVNSIRTKTAN